MADQSYFEDFTARDWEEPTDEAPIRIAMLGLGWWTREEAIPAVEGADHCETTVLVSRTADRAASVAEDLELEGIEAAISYDDFHDGAATDAYDAVYICTPNALHREYVESAAEFGKAILCEKPMEATVDDAEAIVEACADVPLMIAYRLHTEPVARRARELIRGGAIGDVVSVLGHMSDTMLAFASTDTWRLDPDLSGGTTVNDIGIYPLNTIRFVLESDPEAVYATTDAERDAYEGVDEHAAFQLEFPDHVHASCTVSHSAQVASSLRFVGTDGELTLEGLFFPWQDKVLRLSTDDVETEYRPETVDQMREEFDYFANCLQRGVDPEPDGEHGLVDMYAIDALYRSAETGQRVELE